MAEKTNKMVTENGAIVEEIVVKPNIFKRAWRGIVKHKTSIITGITCLTAGGVAGYVLCNAVHYDRDANAVDAAIDNVCTPDVVEKIDDGVNNILAAEEAASTEG